MNHNQDSLVKMGRQASFDYFSNGSALTTSITKIAQDNDLNAQQIKRVCETANKATMIQIYKSASDNTEEFDLANHKDVMEKLSKVEDPYVPTSTDYLSPPPSEITSRTKIATEILYEEKPWQIMDKIAGLKKQAGRLELELIDAQREQILELSKYAGLKEQLVEAIKGALASGHKVKDIISVAVQAMPGAMGDIKKVVTEALSKIKGQPGVSSNGFLSNVWSGIKGFFKGAEKVDESLISKALQEANGKVGLKVINGESKLYGKLRAIYDQNKSLKRCNRTARNVKDKLTVVRKDLNAAKPKEGEWY